ncbi:MAG: hypothetical protein Q8O41_07485 [Candidatus Methanoperedens sp.]|nr:hypothetical protein [Candidatus Methanoperedens sp.]
MNADTAMAVALAFLLLIVGNQVVVPVMPVAARQSPEFGARAPVQLCGITQCQ